MVTDAGTAKVVRDYESFARQLSSLEIFLYVFISL
jgi:hypothetical protein